MLPTKLSIILIFFDFIHFTFASNKKSNPILRDTEDNIGRDVEPIEAQMQPVSNPHPLPKIGLFYRIFLAVFGDTSHVPMPNSKPLEPRNPIKIPPAPQTKESTANKLKKLLDKEDYNGIAKLGDEMNKKGFSEHLCSAMTNIGHYKNLYQCLTDRDMIPDFLVHGNQSLVEEAIVEFPTYSTERYIHNKDINKAIIRCLDEDRPNRVSSLFGDVRTRFAKLNQRYNDNSLDPAFKNFFRNFFIDYFRGRGNSSLRRFIVLHVEELRGKHPEIFETFFMALLYFLACYIYDTDLRQFYSDLMGQSSLSMPTVLARGFLPGKLTSFLQQPYILHNWREAISESLNGKYPNTGKDLWDVIMAMYPDEFLTEFPPSDITRTAVLMKFKSKQDLEDDWTRKNVPILLKKLETTASIIPTVLWNIVFQYATITWTTTLSWDTNSTNEIIEIEDSVTLERDPQQRQIIIHNQEQFEELFNQEKYDEIIKLGDDMESKKFLRCLCPLLTTLDRLKGLFRYLENRKMLLTFFVYGSAKLADEAIIEFGNPQSVFYTYVRLIVRAITFFLNKGTYERVIEILGAAKARYMKLCVGMDQSKWEAMFREFMVSWFTIYSPDENTFQIKHFLTLHGKDFAMKYPDIFDIFCESLVRHLVPGLPYPKAATLLTDLVAQRSLLTPTTFAKGFLSFNDNEIRRNFINYGWKEAIKEGLKQEYPNGGEQLWKTMLHIFPYKFNGTYPNTDELRAKVCARIITKKKIEDEWFEKNMPKLLKHFEDIAAFLPKTVMKVIYEYLTFTWIIS